ncbi:hypothetical protein BpHYR1_002437 [Brachionus plicatilis]|uniref:Uncharacterized protein n=1 Tax=Brachionus plicatilis TaxID=10195 RepID=A0A3M7QXB9_BRAPC|nr:hypothetical protein BpHYR1_002437 [Brachionus plicatilis]
MLMQKSQLAYINIPIKVDPILLCKCDAKVTGKSEVFLIKFIQNKKDKIRKINKFLRQQKYFSERFVHIIVNNS